MEKILIIYMVMLGGFWVWCFWWAFNPVPPSDRIWTRAWDPELIKKLYLEVKRREYQAVFEANRKIIYQKTYQLSVKEAKELIDRLKRIYSENPTELLYEEIKLTQQILNEYWKNTQK